LKISQKMKIIIFVITKHICIYKYVSLQTIYGSGVIRLYSCHWVYISLRNQRPSGHHLYVLRVRLMYSYILMLCNGDCQ